jgi:Electron transfer DM13
MKSGTLKRHGKLPAGTLKYLLTRLIGKIKLHAAACTCDCDLSFRWCVRHRLRHCTRVFSVSLRVPAAAGNGTTRRIHANPSDPIHWGRGKVSVYQRTVFLETDFEVGPGPAFHVYLVPAAGIRDEASVKSAMFIDLGGLRAFKGSQRYPIPAGVDLKNYPSVVIWCERFGVLISPADLMPATK